MMASVEKKGRYKVFFTSESVDGINDGAVFVIVDFISRAEW